MRKLAGFGASLCSAIALSGCVEITDDQAAQPEALGDVVVTTKICVPNDDTAPCRQTNTNQPGGTPREGQLLIAYRVPSGATAPATITLTRGGSLTLTAEPAYTQQLNTAIPVAGAKWVGYISPHIPVAQQTEAEATVTARFSLPRGADGAPWAGGFPWRTVAGARSDPANTPTRPVECDPQVNVTHYEDQGTGTLADDEDTICVASPDENANATYPVITTNTGTLTVNDVGVIKGTTVDVTQGTATSIPFEVKATGNTFPVMTVTAGTSAPNATATPSTSPVQVVAGTQALPVSVNVPANTPVGTYDVTLTLATGAQLRSNTWKINVVAPPAQAPPPGNGGGGTPLPPPPGPPANVAPVLTAAFATKQKLAKVLKSGVKLNVSCNEACTGKVTLKVGKTTVATGKGNSAAGGKFTVAAKFTKAAQKKYRKAKKLKLAATFEATDAGGLKSTKSASITLKR